MDMRICLTIGILSLFCLQGCGGPSPVVGGTSGKVFAAGVPMRDVEVRAYGLVDGTWSDLGTGISGVDGTFRLIQAGAKGPLTLGAGDYRFTLASVGPDPFVLPVEYGDPATTPLTRTWANNAEVELDLHIPLPQQGVPELAPSPGAVLSVEPSLGDI